MSGINFDIVGIKSVSYDGDEEEATKAECRKAINALKSALQIQENMRNRQHIIKKETVLDKYKSLIKTGKPKRAVCSVYDTERDSTYELFRTYYKLVKTVLVIEKRQEMGSARGVRRTTLKQQEKNDICRVVQYAYWRWMDIGTPSISGYNRYRELIKYGTLFLTLIANGFKLALARMGGRASFVGTALQGLAHLSFALYFIFLTQDDKALALPKIVGLVISIVSCVWIADAGNGFL